MCSFVFKIYGNLRNLRKTTHCTGMNRNRRLIIIVAVIAITLLAASLIAIVIHLKSNANPPTETESTGRSLTTTPSTDQETNAVYPVWFGTNRKPNSHGTDFTAERNETNIYGRVDVYIPQAHRFGEIGTGFWTRLLRGDLRNDSLRMQLVEQEPPNQFYTEINAAIRAAQGTGDQPQALVFVHGYNESFEEAAVRAAQIGFDLKVPGPTAFFSWPSQGTFQGYAADEASIEASEGAVADFLVDFAAHCGTTNISIIAHSMGNRGLLRALQRISANAEIRSKVKFNQIILAAPDIDRDLFLGLASLYPTYARRTTLYESDGDMAVYMSSIIHKAPRAGYFHPYTVAPGIDTVAVPYFNLDSFGHDYFAEQEALMYDMRDLMLNDDPPARRMRISPMTADGLNFWTLGR